MKNKGGRPKKDPSELRLKNVMVTFSVEEWESLQENMQSTGYDSAAVFLRVSGLRSQVPAKVFVPSINREHQNAMINCVNYLKKIKDGKQLSEGKVYAILDVLNDIAKSLMNTNFQNNNNNEGASK
jgi:hypothetical protein